MMDVDGKEALFQKAELVLQDKAPLQPPTPPAAVGKTRTIDSHYADLATIVDRGSGVICIDSMPSQRICRSCPLR